MVGFVYLLLAYLHAISLLIFFFFPLSPSSCPFISFKQEIKKYEMSLIERLLPEIECSVQSKVYSPTSYLLGWKAPHQLYILSY